MTTPVREQKTQYFNMALGYLAAAACSALALAIIFQPQQCLALGKQIKATVLKERLKVQLPLGLTAGALALALLVKNFWPKPKVSPFLTGEKELF